MNDRHFPDWVNELLRIRIPDRIPRSRDRRSAWVKPFRKYIGFGFRDSVFLRDALRIARKYEIEEIVNILSSLGWQQVEPIAINAISVAHKLWQQHRLEEAYSLLLLPLMTVASWIEKYHKSRLQDQRQMLVIGLTAAQRGLKLCRTIGDDLCQAMFCSLQGRGLYELNRLQDAVEVYHGAAQLYRQLEPKNSLMYANALNGLGLALSKSGQYEAAIEEYNKALDVYQHLARKEAHLYADMADTLINKAMTLSEVGYHREANVSFEKAIAVYRGLGLRDRMVKALANRGWNYIHKQQYTDALGYLREAGNILQSLLADSDDSELRRQMLDEHVRIFDWLLICLMKLKQHEEALEVTERGRDTWLCEQFASPDKGGHLAAHTLSYQEILQLAKDEELTILILRVTEGGTYAFLIYPNATMEAIEVPDFTLERMRALVVSGWFMKHYYDRERYIIEDSILSDIYRELLSPIYQQLRQRGDSVSQRLLIIPNRALTLLPLHACWWEDGRRRRYLIDYYTIQYAPSITTFRSLQQRNQRRSRGKPLVISNPMGDLPYSDYECAQLAAWNGGQMLRGGNATVEAVLQHAPAAHILHFNCHGCYLLHEPLASSLQLANDKRLTVKNIIESLRLPNAWLVSLSACETATVHPEAMTDEHIGLASSLLYAGSPTVWGTFWKVSSFASAFLIRKAYELIILGYTKINALHTAQSWLRKAEAGELANLLEAYLRSRAEVDAQSLQRIRNILNWLRQLNPDAQPFAHPYYWAGFQYLGA